MAPRTPHVGLSKNGRPPSLLKTVNWKQVNRFTKASVASDPPMHSTANHRPTLPDLNRLVEDEDINKPPMDSDEEEEEATKTVNGQDLSPIRSLRQSNDRERIDTSDLPSLKIDLPNSSDEEDFKSADIRPTVFQPGSRRLQRYGSSSRSRNKTEDGIGPVRESKELLKKRRTQRTSSPKEILNQSRRTIATGSTETGPTDSKLGSQFTDDHGFAVTEQGRPRGSQLKRERRFGSSQLSRSSPEKPFQNPPPEPESIRTPEPEFKMPEINISPCPKFQVPAIRESPLSSQETPRKFQAPIGISPSKSESTSISIENNEMPDLAIQASPELPLRKKRLLENIGTESPSPAFILPDVVRDILQDANVDFEAVNGSLNIRSSDTESLSLGDSVFPRSPETAPVTCPMCGGCVDAEFLRSFNNGEWMNTRMQARFCQAHKRVDAQNDWHARGYPTIDWFKLDARIEKHHRQIRALLDGASSYYRNVLEASVKSGERTLAQSLRSDRQLLPGYYGSRGLKVMSENIMQRFSPMLRRIAIQDRLVSSRGVAGYVQAVLVPELAILLICEDMDVGAEKARSIMTESAAAGDLVHEEEADVLVRQDDDHENDNWGD